jgi:hypothetical protein
MCAEQTSIFLLVLLMNYLENKINEKRGEKGEKRGKKGK